jgi:hypothetical protein
MNVSTASLPSDIPSREEFAALIANAIVQSGEKRPLRHDPDLFGISRRDEPSIPQLSLDSAYSAFRCGDHAGRDTLVRNAVRAWHRSDQGLPADFEDAAHDLLPVVNSYAVLEFTKFQDADSARLRSGSRPASTHPGKRIAEHLFASVAYDMPESLRTLTGEDFEQWGVDFDIAMQRAMENLRTLGHEFVRLRAPAAAYRLNVADVYCSSRLLLPEIFQGLGLRGSPVVMVPGKDALFVAGAQDDEALEAMLQCVKGNRFHRRVGDYAYRLGSRGWAPWLPAPSHRLHAPFREVAMHTERNLCEFQKNHLYKGKDAFTDGPNGFALVGALMVSGDRDPLHPRTICVWTKDCTALLPKADYVAFVELHHGEQSVAAIREYPWPVVAEVLGGMLRPQGMYPERYRTEGFPTDAQFAAVEVAAQRAKRKQRDRFRRKPR